MSKKYVIEIKPEYEDTTRGIMVLGARDSNLYMDALAVEDMEELTSDYINEHFGDLQDTAYQRGLEEGKQVAVGAAELREKLEYQKGLKDAWEAARKVALNSNDGGLCLENLDEIFDCYTLQQVFKGYTAQQTIAKLKAYEEKQKADDKIEVGDTVNLKEGSRDNDGIVTKSWDNDRYFIMWADGAGGVWDKEYIVKTGRHFDIASILEDMRND